MRTRHPALVGVILGGVVFLCAARTQAQISFAAAVPTGLKGAYAMSDGTDSSGNGKTATLTSTTTAPGKYGSAQRFTGNPSHMTIPTLNVGGAFTLEAWAFFSSGIARRPAPHGIYSYWQAIIYKGSDDFFLNEFGDGYLTVGFRNAPGPVGTMDGVVQLIGPSKVTYDAWHHVAGVFDGTTMRLLIDGVQVASMQTTGPVLGSTQPIEVGGSVSDQGWLGGLVDDVRIYDRALSNAEITSDMATPVDAIREAVVSWDLEVWSKGTTPTTGGPAAIINYLKTAAACNLAPLPVPSPPVLTVANPSKARFADPDAAAKECELIIQTFINSLPLGVGYTSTLRAHGATTTSDRSGVSNVFDRVAQAMPPLPAGSPAVR